MVLKPVCVKCQCFYRPVYNGFFFTEMMPTGGHHGPPELRRGTKAPELWQPYKLWCGDKWQCPECEHEIVVGVIAGPVAEHYQPDFNSLVTRLRGDQLKVNDC